MKIIRQKVFSAILKGEGIEKSKNCKQQEISFPEQ